MSKLIIVGGSKNKPSGVIDKLHSLFVKSGAFDLTWIFNGEEPPRDLSHDADLLLWFPDISNEEPKEYPIKGRGAVLVCSKVMRAETTRVDAVSRIFNIHGNAVTAITKKDDKFEFELIDALNNTWIKTTDLQEFVDEVLKLYSWTKNSVRKSLSYGGNFNIIWSPQLAEDLDVFIRTNTAIALKVAAGCGNRFFGNFSTRCTKLFPSSRIGPSAFTFSPRNTDKSKVTTKDLVPTNFMEYFGDRKPSVDAPVQLELYRMLPHINFMIHGHAYIRDGAEWTQKYFPCGDLREVNEALHLLSKGATKINLKNHGFLLVGETVEDFRVHLKECKFDMIGG